MTLRLRYLPVFPGARAAASWPTQRFALALAFQEEFGPDRPWRYNVYGNIAAAQLVCQDVHQAFDSGLRGNVGTIGREILRQHAARKRNNPAARWLCAARRAPTPGRLCAGWWR